MESCTKSCAPTIPRHIPVLFFSSLLPNPSMPPRLSVPSHAHPMPRCPVATPFYQSDFSLSLGLPLAAKLSPLPQSTISLISLNTQQMRASTSLHLHRCIYTSTIRLNSTARYHQWSCPRSCPFAPDIHAPDIHASVIPSVAIAVAESCRH
jgi:hypothetical protein